MHGSKQKGLSALPLTLLGAGLLALEWLEIISPPLRYYFGRGAEKVHLEKAEVGPHSAFETISAIYHGSSQVYEFPLLGIVLALELVALAWLAILQIARAVEYYSLTRRGIVVIDLTLRLDFEGPDLSKSTLQRHQRFHANRSGVTAYFFNHQVTSPSGLIVDGSFDLASSKDNALITKNMMPDVSDKRIDLIERFTEELPRSYILKFMPASWKTVLAPLFPRHIVSRKSSIKHLNEFNHSLPRVSVTSNKYPVNNVSIEVSFPSDIAPKLADVSAYLISENVVRDNPVARSSRSTPDRTVFMSRVGRLHAQDFRLEWVNRPEGLQPKLNPHNHLRDSQGLALKVRRGSNKNRAPTWKLPRVGR